MNAPVVWLLSDGAPGHLSQSRGIVDALQSVTPARTVIVPLKVRSSAWKRLGRFCLPWIRDPVLPICQGALGRRWRPTCIAWIW